MTPATEPFGYWVEQKHADPVLLRKPAYIPEPSPLRTVTPLYTLTEAASQPREEELDIAKEMAAFEAKYPCCDHKKHRDGEIIAGRARYADPEIDKMFSAWLSARSTPRLIATPSNRAVFLAKQYARVTEDEVGGLPIGHIAAVIRDLSAALTQRPPEQAGAVPAGWEIDAKEADVRLVVMLDRLREEEADSVTILCDNPDGPPNNAVECCGFWTGFIERRFEGSSLYDAMQSAVAARDEAVKSGYPPMLSAAPTPPDAGPGEWQPIETCPSDGRAFIVWSPSSNLQIAYGRYQDGSFGNATHWMRPDAPKAPPQTLPDAGIGSDGAGELPLFSLMPLDRQVAIARCDISRGQTVTADMLKNVRATQPGDVGRS